MFSNVKYRVLDVMPALKSRNYRLYFSGQGISLIGTWMQAVAVQWLIYPVLTTNKSLLGIISAVNLAPTVVFVLIAGVLVDRINKRKAFISFQILYALFAFILFLLVITGTIQIWHLFVLTFLEGIVFAFENPTRQTFMVELVEKKDLPSALSLASGMFNGARALGPALAGILIATVGIAPAYLLNSISFLFVIGSLLLMKFPAVDHHAVHPSLAVGLKEGFVYIKQNKIMMLLLAIVAILTIFSWPIATLLPIFAHDIFHVGEMGFGLLQSFFGIGAVISAITFSKLFEKIKKKYLLPIIGIVTVTISSLVFAWSPIFPLSLVSQMITGWAVGMTYSTVNSLVIMNIPIHLRGRMMSLYTFVLMGGMPIGALLASGSVSYMGARLTVTIYSLALFISAFILIALSKGKYQEKISAMV